MAQPRKYDKSWTSLADLEPAGLFTKDQELVTIVVGPEKESFTIHKQQALNASPFLQACLGGKFNEDRTGVLDLPDQDAKTFSFVMDFIYTGSFGKDGGASSIDALRFGLELCDPEFAGASLEWENMSVGSPDAPKVETPQIVWEREYEMIRMVHARWRIYAEVWKLADYLQMPVLQNLAMKRLHAEFEYQYAFTCQVLVRLCYSGTPVGAALRKFVADIHGLGYRKISTWKREWLDDLIFQDFLFDVQFSREELNIPIESIQKSKPFYEVSRYLVDEKPMVVRSAEPILSFPRPN